MASSAAVLSRIEYDSREFPPMETDGQIKAYVYGQNVLRACFRDRSDVYVSGSMTVYYEKGNNSKFLGPDLFVVFGVPAKDRRVYLAFDEGFPDFIMKTASAPLCGKI